MDSQWDSELSLAYQEVNLGWHHGERLRNAVKTFHEKYAKEPKGLAAARTVHKEIMDKINDYLRMKNVCVNVEYTGSAYEGTQVTRSPSGDDLEFDNQFILNGGNQMTATRINDAPGYVHAEIKQSSLCYSRNTNSSSNGYGRPAYDKDTSDLKFGVFENNYANSEKTAEKFFGEVQKCINNDFELRNKVKLRKHGPAVQMDVYHHKGGPRYFSVDLVPTYKIGKDYYVSKPLPQDVGFEGAIRDPSLAWRQSCSLQEKSKLDAADYGNQWRKRILRVLKIIISREPNLHSLTSYHLKTALFRTMDKYSDWSELAIGERLINVLQELEKCLANGKMPHYYIDDVNLLSSFGNLALRDMRQRIKRLINSEIEMMRVLEA